MSEENENKEQKLDSTDVDSDLELDPRERQVVAEEDEEEEASHIFRIAVELGLHRLQRNWLEMCTSGFVAGMNVTFGVVAAGAVSGAVLASFGAETEMFAQVLGAAVFPIGFIFVIIGKSELFTENFLVPTASVIAGRERIRSLMHLWVFTLLGNLLGAVVVAKMLSMEHYHGVPAVHTIEHIQHLAEFLVIERDLDASFFAGVFAGWLITLMTWLMLSARHVFARIVVIWCVGFMIMINKFNHVVVNTSEVLVAMFTGNETITYSAWLTNNFLPTLVGNMVGGLVFVTLLEYLKVMRVRSKWE